MLIKFDADDALVSQIKALTGQAVGSKAFHAAACQSLEMLDDIRGLRAQVAQLRETVAVQRRTIEAARSAAAQLLEAADQPDLLNC
ncbi:hypothetical protein D3C78_996330 [compost metagenome]